MHPASCVVDKQLITKNRAAPLASESIFVVLLGWAGALLARPAVPWRLRRGDSAAGDAAAVHIRPGWVGAGGGCRLTDQRPRVQRDTKRERGALMRKTVINRSSERVRRESDERERDREKARKRDLRPAAHALRFLCSPFKLSVRLGSRDVGGNLLLARIMSELLAPDVQRQRFN